MYIHTYICINIQEVHALQHTFWIVSRSNPPIRPMHLVESSCTLGSGFGTGIAPYHSSKPPTSESQQKLPMWKKTTRIFVVALSWSCFLTSKKQKKCNMILYFPLFVTFQNTTRFWKNNTNLFHTGNHYCFWCSASSIAWWWLTQQDTGWLAGKGWHHEISRSIWSTYLSGRSVGSRISSTNMKDTNGKMQKRTGRSREYPWVLNIHVGLPCHQSMKRTLKTLI